jgi:hypothetical protein
MEVQPTSDPSIGLVIILSVILVLVLIIGVG